jgi:hypothetical protein
VNSMDIEARITAAIEAEHSFLVEVFAQFVA